MVMNDMIFLGLVFCITVYSIYFCVVYYKKTVNQPENVMIISDKLSYYVNKERVFSKYSVLFGFCMIIFALLKVINIEMPVYIVMSMFPVIICLSVIIILESYYFTKKKKVLSILGNKKFFLSIYSLLFAVFILCSILLKFLM